jgi:glycosyltransferase AglD
MKINLKKVYSIFFTIVGILILVALIHNVGLARWGKLLQGMDKMLLLPAVIVYAAAWLFRTLRLRSLVRHTAGTFPITRLFEIHIASFALNAVLPARVGDVTMAGLFKREGIKIGMATALVVQTRILDILALVLVMIPSWFWLTRKDAPIWMILSFLFCLLLVSVSFGIAWVDQRRKISSCLRKAGKKSGRPFWDLVLRKIGDAYDAYHHMTRDKSLVSLSVFFSVIIWIFEGGVAYALFLAFGISIPFEAAVLAVALGNAGKGFQITPGGVGVYEGILTAVLVEFGAPFDVAVTVAVLDHLLKKGFNLAFGFYALIRLRSSSDAMNVSADFQKVPITAHEVKKIR